MIAPLRANPLESYFHRVPFHVEEQGAGDFAIVHRSSGEVIEKGFTSYALAWTWLVNRLPKRDRRR